MNEQKNNGRGIFYGVIGVATLVVAIIGATFAYFTASASDENTITGNMASIDLGLTVTRVVDPGATTGMIPMSNNMIEVAVDNTSTKGVCVDDNGNAVCQIYQIDITNESTAGVFVDGYVALINGSGTQNDYTPSATAETTTVVNATTMRWAQVFKTSATKYTTVGKQNLGTVGETAEFASLDNKSDTTGKNAANIRDLFAGIKDEAQFVTGSGVTVSADTTGKGVLTKKSIGTSNYAVIGTNYIRVSNHAFKTAGTLSADESYEQSKDVTSALVYNQQIAGGTPGNYNSTTYYVAVWLTETGTDQTLNGTDANASTTQNGFFQGQVKFISAQGSEVSATFGGYTRVPTVTTPPAGND